MPMREESLRLIERQAVENQIPLSPPFLKGLISQSAENLFGNAGTGAH